MLEMLETVDNRWLEFLQSQDQVNIFHTPAWSIMLNHAYLFHCFMLADINSEGKVTAGIPIAERKSFTGKKSWVSLPYTDHCAPLTTNPGEKTEFYYQLDQFIKKYADSNFELRWSFPEINSLLIKQDFVLHNLPLHQDFDQNLKLIQPGSKRNARVAVKNGIRIEINKDSRHLEEFYRLHLLTRRKQGVPIQPWNFFSMIKSDLLEKDLGFIMTAYQGSKCLAAAMFLTWNKNITYKYGASDPAGLNLRPNDLIMQETIRWGCENGYSSLDFGRTDLSNKGLRHYKSCWGALESPLFYSYAPIIPAQRPEWMMNTLGKIIRNSPLWVCRLFGEVLYRYAG